MAGGDFADLREDGVGRVVGPVPVLEQDRDGRPARQEREQPRDRLLDRAAQRFAVQVRRERVLGM